MSGRWASIGTHTTGWGRRKASQWVWEEMNEEVLPLHCATLRGLVLLVMAGAPGGFSTFVQEWPMPVKRVDER